MRQLLLGLCLLLPLQSFAQENIEYTEYSYSELIEMIQAEEDTIFRLSDAKIIFNPETDSLFLAESDPNDFTKYSHKRQETLVINKHIRLSNISISTEEGDFFKLLGFHNIHFKKAVEIQELEGLFGSIAAQYDEGLTIFTSTSPLSDQYNETPRVRLLFDQSKFNGLFIYSLNKDLKLSFLLTNSLINNISNKSSVFILRGHNLTTCLLRNNSISGGSSIEIQSTELITLDVKSNHFLGGVNTISLNEKADYVVFGDNIFDGPMLIDVAKNNDFLYRIEWSQFKGKLTSWNDYNLWISEPGTHEKMPDSSDMYSVVNINYYKEKILTKSNDLIKKEMAIRGIFYNAYKENFDIESANLVYAEIKDLETQAFKNTYSENPTFKSFFTWKINEFLREFSAYGTEPARALVFSVYVILAFALVYLFFPNHWDSHGKNRIKDRFLFFHKYLRHNQGIQDVYLEGQKAELASAYAFQEVMDKHKSEVPGFFYNAAKPLYRWSVAGTSLYAKLLSRIDFLKGSWKDTDPAKRKLRTFLTIIVFLFALLYDIFIKMLNALMLSINTFTTLGFGEIPIKGLPRYLAIIQGFIGWFMLTIFSVSLISQLLN